MTCPKAQQVIMQDELDAAGIEQAWLAEIAKRVKPQSFPSEIKTERTDRETQVTTLWCRGQAVGIAVRQRDGFNFTVLTLVEFPHMVQHHFEANGELISRSDGDANQ